MKFIKLTSIGRPVIINAENISALTVDVEPKPKPEGWTPQTHIETKNGFYSVSETPEQIVKLAGQIGIPSIEDKEGPIMGG